MSDVTLNRVYKCPIATLQRFAPRFQSALADPDAGPDVLAHLGPAFATNLCAQIDLLQRLSVAQSHAHGAIGELCRAKQLAVARILLLCGSARNAAKVVYARDDAVKHGEFFVGEPQPRAFATIVHRGEIVLGACRARADALATHGWSPQLTADLDEALASAKTLYNQRHATSDEKEGFTAEQIAAANGLYRMLQAIQNVARVVYAKARVAQDPTVGGKRAKFLLGEFPPSRTHPPAAETAQPVTTSSPPPLAAPAAPPVAADAMPPSPVDAPSSSPASFIAAPPQSLATGTEENTSSNLDRCSWR